MQASLCMEGGLVAQDGDNMEKIKAAATNLLTAIRNHPVITFCLDGKPNIKIEVDRYVLGGTVLALVLILWLASVI